jgi:hypothetical protein
MEQPPHNIINNIRELLFHEQSRDYIQSPITKQYYHDEKHVEPIIEYLEKKEYGIETFKNQFNETVILVKWKIPPIKQYTILDLQSIYKQNQTYQKGLSDSSQKDRIIDSFMTNLEEEILTDVKAGRLEKHVFPNELIIVEWYEEIAQKIRYVFPDMTVSIEKLRGPTYKSYLELVWDWNA